MLFYVLLQINKIIKENSKGTVNHCARDHAESEICPVSAEPGNFILSAVSGEAPGRVDCDKLRGDPVDAEPHPPHQDGDIQSLEDL
jgi:hypothetical protein